MGKLPVVEGREVVRALQRHGFELVRTRGSHVRMHHPDGRRTTVPVHAGKDLPKGTLRTILRDADLTPDDLRL